MLIAEQNFGLPDDRHTANKVSPTAYNHLIRRKKITSAVPTMSINPNAQ